MSCSSLLVAGIALSALTALQPFEAVEPHMGTLFRIKLYAVNQNDAQQAFHAAFTRITELDDILSDYKPDSEINRLCRTAVHQPVPVSDDLFRVVSASEKLSEQSDGAFDITIGPLTHLWRQARKTGQVPETTAIAEAAGHCGFHKVQLDPSAHTIELQQSGMQLDVGGIAKGYAADEALRVLSKCGIHSALVAASGDLVFSNAPPGHAGWKIGIDSLDSAEAPFTRVLMLANRAVSTSGPEEQHLDVNGKRYSHIINPKTGMGLTTDITATVVALTGTQADALATAVTVLGAERGLDLVKSTPGASAIIVAGGRVWKSEVQP